jgi:dCMP deaminase
MSQQSLIYMQTAEAFSLLSKATRAKVGAILVTNQGVVIPGVNGTASGTDNACEKLEYTIANVSYLVTKPETIHAELNCVLKCAKEGLSCLDSVLYTTLSPCLPCSAMLKQAGVKTVYYRTAYRDLAGVEYLKQNGVLVKQI